MRIMNIEKLRISLVLYTLKYMLFMIQGVAVHSF